MKKKFIIMFIIIILNSCMEKPSNLKVNYIDKNLHNVERKSFYIARIKDFKDSNGKEITSGGAVTAKLAIEIKKRFPMPYPLNQKLLP